MLLRTVPNGCVVLSNSGADDRSQQAVSDSERSQLFLNAVQISGVRPGTEFRARGLNRVDRQSAFAIVNPSESETADVRIEWLGSRGQIRETVEITLPPLNRVARFTKDLFEGILSGLLRFESSIPIAVGGIVVVEPDGLWISLPVERVDLHEQLLLNWGKWQSRSGPNYKFEMEWTLGQILVGDRARVVVEEGDIVLVESVDDGTVLPTEGFFTIDEMFERLESEIKRPPDRISINYHPTDGYPQQADVDPLAGAADEEFGFQIFQLEVNP